VRFNLILYIEYRDMVQITDGRDKIIFTNPSAEKILGFSSNEMVGSDIWRLQSAVGLAEVANEEEEEDEEASKEEKDVRPV
jgi:PAS domain S-box-containing protein